MGRPRKHTVNMLADDDPLRALICCLTPENKVVLVPEDVMSEWPQAQRQALSDAGLLAEAAPARQTNCSECEHLCQSLPVQFTHGIAWVHCSYPQDTARIEIAEDRLKQRKITLDNLAAWLKKAFEARDFFEEQAHQAHDEECLGIVLADRLRLVLSLVYKENAWCLTAAGNTSLLTEIIGFDGQCYALIPDYKEMLLQTDKSTEPALQRGARLLAEVEFRKGRPRQFSGAIYPQVAAENGISVDALKGILKKGRKDRATQALKKEYLVRMRQDQET